MTSRISELISASAAASRKAAGAPPRVAGRWPGQGAIMMLAPPVSAVHSSSVTNGMTG